MKGSFDSTTTIRSELNKDRYVDGIYPRSFFAGLLTNTVKDGGTTNFWPHEGNDPKLRYVIGDARFGTILSARDFRSGVDLETFLHPYICKWRDTHYYTGFGTWINPKNGTVSIDPISVFYNEGPARKLAGFRGELAIYDLKERKSIYLQ